MSQYSWPCWNSSREHPNQWRSCFCSPVSLHPCSKWHSSENAMKGQQWWPGHCCAAEVTAMEHRPLLFQELDLFKVLPKHGWFPPPGCTDERESTNNSCPSKRGSVSPGQPISGAWAVQQIEPVYLWLWKQRVTKPKSKLRRAGCTLGTTPRIPQTMSSKKLDLCPE